MTATYIILIDTVKGRLMGFRLYKILLRTNVHKRKLYLQNSNKKKMYT